MQAPYDKERCNRNEYQSNGKQVFVEAKNVQIWARRVDFLFFCTVYFFQDLAPVYLRLPLERSKAQHHHYTSNRGEKPNHIIGAEAFVRLSAFTGQSFSTLASWHMPALASRRNSAKTLVTAQIWALTCSQKRLKGCPFAEHWFWRLQYQYNVPNLKKLWFGIDWEIFHT